MKNKKLIRIFALALALLLCLSLLPMAALAAEGEEDAIIFEDPTGDDPADEPGDPDAGSDDAVDPAPDADGTSGSDTAAFNDAGDDDTVEALAVESFLIGLLSYDEDGEPVNTEAHEAEVGDVLVAMITGCNWPS